MRKITDTNIWTVSLIRTGECSFVSIGFQHPSVRLRPKQQRANAILAERE
jgi:hypothetical protein